MIGWWAIVELLYCILWDQSHYLFPFFYLGAYMYVGAVAMHNWETRPPRIFILGIHNRSHILFLTIEPYSRAAVPVERGSTFAWISIHRCPHRYTVPCTSSIERWFCDLASIERLVCDLASIDWWFCHLASIDVMALRFGIDRYDFVWLSISSKTSNIGRVPWP
jgi:hypothetical protein